MTTTAKTTTLTPTLTLANTALLTTGASSSIWMVTQPTANRSLIQIDGSGSDTVNIGFGAFNSFTVTRLADGSVEFTDTHATGDVIHIANAATVVIGNTVYDVATGTTSTVKPNPAAASSGGGAAPPGPMATVSAPAVADTAAGQVAGVILQNPTASTVAARFLTFGLTFADGAVPKGGQLTANIGGQTVAVQLDAKDSYTDGSVRSGVVTLAAPSIAANAALPVAFTVASATAPAAPVSMAALTAAGAYSVVVSLAIHNADGSVTHQTVDIGHALAAALKSGTVTTWQSGPLATDVQFTIPVAGSLHLAVDLQRTADGNTMTDVQFDNDAAMQASGGTMTYDVSVAQNGKTVFAQNDVVQYQYTTWRTQIASNGSSPMNVQQDVGALESLGVVDNYDPTLAISAGKIASEASNMSGSTYGVLGSANVTTYMPETGGRGDIGPQPNWNTIWLLTQDPTARAYALAQDEVAGSVPWHLYNPATGNYLTAAAAPTLWDSPDATTNAKTTVLTQRPATGSKGASGWTPDSAHEPDFSYLAYETTGDPYYLDQLNAEASYDVLDLNPTSRDGANAFVTFGALRQQAWSLREIVEAAEANPDGSAMKIYFTQIATNSIQHLQQLEATLGAQEGQVAGWFPDLYGRGNGLIAPFEEDMLAVEVGQAAAAGIAGATQVLSWMTNFIAGRFLHTASGFSVNDAIDYQLHLGDSNNVPYSTWAQLGAANPADPSLLASSDYQAIARAALAQSITYTGSVEAMQAYGWLLANGTAVNTAWYAQNPTWDIVPRLSDGQLLTATEVFIRSDAAATNVDMSHAQGDMLVYENGPGAVTITGGSGIDILFAGSGAATLIGGAGDDMLFGGRGATTFQAGAGDNTMTVGSGAATFDLDPADIASDTISGFRVGTDHLDIAGAPAATAKGSLTALLRGATTDAAGDAVLHLSATHSVTLQGVAHAALGLSIFG